MIGEKELLEKRAQYEQEIFWLKAKVAVVDEMIAYERDCAKEAAAVEEEPTIVEEAVEVI